MKFQRRTKEESKNEISSLVENFDKDLKHYRSEDYLEENVKSEFINKFLQALNWDVNNDNSVSPKYREVVMESKTKVNGRKTRPDYALCVGGNAVMYIEAKPPSCKVLRDEDAAYQLRKYAFSSKKRISVLTDFEEFAVYDTRKKPNENDGAEVSRIKYIKFDEYIDNFDYLWNVFSYDSVMHGSLDELFSGEDGNYYTNDVNDDILDAVEEWRAMLVQGAETKGGKLSARNINMAVQRLMNRFVYIWRTKGL